jgi:hypothetical protein
MSYLQESPSILSRQYNGRVDVKSSTMQPPSNVFSLYDKIAVSKSKGTDYCSSFHSPLLGLWDENNLSIAFFSKENIQILQNGIRYGVYKRSNGQYIIGEQDCDELKIIMRSIFLQYAVNKPDQIPEQIEALNSMVLNYCIQQVYGEAQGRIKYLDDVSTLVIPISPPILANNRDKELVLHEWF